MKKEEVITYIKFLKQSIKGTSGHCRNDFIIIKNINIKINELINKFKIKEDELK